MELQKNLNIKGVLHEWERKFNFPKKKCLKQAPLLHYLENSQNPPVGRPIVAGYDWILTPASIYIGNCLMKFYSEFENILTDSLELIRFIEKNTFPIDGMLFTIDLKSLYTNIPVKDAIE